MWLLSGFFIFKIFPAGLRPLTRMGRTELGMMDTTVNFPMEAICTEMRKTDKPWLNCQSLSVSMSWLNVAKNVTLGLP